MQHLFSENETVQHRHRFATQAVRWWYRMTSPPEPGVSASLYERDVFRRGRTGSQISIILFILLLASLPAALTGANHVFIGILAVSLFLLVLALVLNRQRQVNLAGILVVFSVIVGPIANIITTPGGISTSALPIFSLLVLPVMCTVSFLQPGWVFMVATSSSLFAFFALKFLPSSGELHYVLRTAFPSIITPIILSQFIASTVAYIWVRGARQAIARADQAEEIVRLVRDLAERDRIIASREAQIVRSIAEIERVHQEVANGNFSARIQLNQSNVLWSIGGKLNNLLARYQRLQVFVLELQQANSILQRTFNEKRSKQHDADMRT